MPDNSLRAHIEAKVDTGAQVNILSVEVYNKIFEDWKKIPLSHTVLLDYSGQNLENLGISEI